MSVAPNFLAPGIGFVVGVGCLCELHWIARLLWRGEKREEETGDWVPNKPQAGGGGWGVQLGSPALHNGHSYLIFKILKIKTS